MAVANAGQIDHVQPGLVDESVLTLQANHRSESIWNGQVKHSTKEWLIRVDSHLETKSLRLDFV